MIFILVLVLTLANIYFSSSETIIGESNPLTIHFSDDINVYYNFSNINELILEITLCISKMFIYDLIYTGTYDQLYLILRLFKVALYATMEGQDPSAYDTICELGEYYGFMFPNDQSFVREIEKYPLDTRETQKILSDVNLNVKSKASQQYLVFDLTLNLVLLSTCLVIASITTFLHYYYFR